LRFNHMLENEHLFLYFIYCHEELIGPHGLTGSVQWLS
jgi:hypothetical protein